MLFPNFYRKEFKVAAVRQVVVLNDKDIRDALAERAKLAINGKADGPNIPGSIKVKIELTDDQKQYSAEVSFERT